MNQSEFSYLLIMANPKRQIPLEKEINPTNAKLYLFNFDFFKSLFLQSSIFNIVINNNLKI